MTLVKISGCKGLIVSLKQYCSNRSSHQRCSRKKSVLTNLVKSTGKHLCQGLFLNQVDFEKRLWRDSVTDVFLWILQNLQDQLFTEHFCTTVSVTNLKISTLLKKRLWHRCFAVNFTKFKNTFSYRTPPVAAPDDCSFCSYPSIPEWGGITY